MCEGELIDGGRGRALLQGRGDFGAAYGRNYPNQPQHHDRLDHCEAGSSVVEHCAAAFSPFGSLETRRNRRRSCVSLGGKTRTAVRPRAGPLDDTAVLT